MMNTDSSPAPFANNHQYTGDVTVGGPSDVRELRTLTVRKAAVGDMDNNAYLLTCRVSGAQLLIDAAADFPRLMELVREGSATGRLDTIVTTHAHHDHVGALSAMVASTDARTVAGAADAPDIPTPTTQTVSHGDVIRVGVNDLEVVGLRGHTPGSIALIFRGEGADGDHVFTGDSLFPGGVGATQGDAARFESLITDVEQRLFGVLDDSAHVYPGHGADTTIGTERPHLEEWRERGW
ncbi:MBL fold metallo-hydrolase [Helcobacillus massiliensis]|uniref:Glyoxylase-like metal-dependent hydrolase (Beta-lactamase superfamily II) n=2 Tax=Helcobacillus massiliensis TaxID=521392 RepID=A0A839QU28_9MICO|nr:MBL fold metallo-hydrolase [Helcobacillus massiliensis]MBB3022359.1 glyoxylase-like metal-dependent hydrolase (beta-lactamase superfamily II) [Helcobacillus massiliensis]MCT1556997.1 MBL fold metallo-hydrolase [Helcobacillus massiliensis]MCT2035386.1 MBL fold metallo-hydrolase [Helcobacillus massiliensis]MCT2331399.1 MBL fold metallo-hydrolase [Helcobacillus massiliensis]MDK7741065.1 MBL fold metallo-hydrolase [Helcobacillus massiliensis]